jgi:hypothetical protein
MIMNTMWRPATGGHLPPLAGSALTGLWAGDRHSHRGAVGGAPQDFAPKVERLTVREPKWPCQGWDLSAFRKARSGFALVT